MAEGGGAGDWPSPRHTLKAIEDSQTISLVDRIRENSLFRALEQMLGDRGSFNGGVGALHDLLMLSNERPDRAFPKTASHLSTQLATAQTGDGESWHNRRAQAQGS